MTNETGLYSETVDDLIHGIHDVDDSYYERLCRAALTYRAKAKACQDEIERLKESASSAISSATRIDDRLLFLLDAHGKKKHTAGPYTISRRSGRERVCVVGDVPPEYCSAKAEFEVGEVTPEVQRALGDRLELRPDKHRIAEDLRAGRHVPGADFEIGPDTVKIK